MPNLPLAAIFTSLLLASLASAQGKGERATGLSRTWQTFRAADRDGDGRIALHEAIRSKIPAQDFAREDHDHDAFLSRDEFVLYYRQLLVRAGRAVALDLETEAARIQAVRRARSRCATASSPRGSGSFVLVTDVTHPQPVRVLTTDGPAGKRMSVRARQRREDPEQHASRPPSEIAAQSGRALDGTKDDL